MKKIVADSTEHYFPHFGLAVDDEALMRCSHDLPLAVCGFMMISITSST